jgi:hypothetical protein
MAMTLSTKPRALANLAAEARIGEGKSLLRPRETFFTKFCFADRMPQYFRSKGTAEEQCTPFENSGPEIGCARGGIGNKVVFPVSHLGQRNGSRALVPPRPGLSKQSSPRGEPSFEGRISRH